MAGNIPHRLHKHNGPVVPETGLPGHMADLRKFAKFRPASPGKRPDANQTTYIVFHADIAHENKPFLFSYGSMRRILNYLGTAALMTGLFLLGLLA